MFDPPHTHTHTNNPPHSPFRLSKYTLFLALCVSYGNQVAVLLSLRVDRFHDLQAPQEEDASPKCLIDC